MKEQMLSTWASIATPSAVAVIAGACNAPSIQTEDVVTVSACTSGSCTGVADGESPLTVKTCLSTAVDNPKTDLQTKLTTTRGRWLGAAADTPSTLLVPFGSERCISRELVSPLEAGTATVGSEVAGYRAEFSVEFLPVPLASLEITPQPAFLDGNAATMVVLNVAARAATGKATNGTSIVATVVDRSPPGAAVTLYPSSALLDDKQTASFSLTVAAGTKSVSIKVDTRPPSSMPVSETITLTVADSSTTGDAGS